MGTTRIIELLSVQSPFCYGEDENSRALFAVNFVGRADTTAYTEKVVISLIEFAGLGTFGVDLFAGPQADIPGSDGPIVSVVSTAGFTPLETHTGEKYESISFQVAVRSRDYLAGRERIYSLWALLDGKREVTVTTT